MSKKYKVIIPVMTRCEEIHEIEANSPEEAIELALLREPDDWVDDPDYYEPQKDNIRVE